MGTIQYDCIVCFGSYENGDDLKNLCVNSKEHILCNDCYWHIVEMKFIN